MMAPVSRRIPSFCRLWFLLLSLPAAAETPATNAAAGELTLAQALRLDEEQNPELAAARLDLAATDGRVQQAAARPNPGLSYEMENFGGARELRGIRGADQTLQLEQPLELGGKRQRRMAGAAAERRLSACDLAARQQDVRAETQRRFAAVLGAQQRVALAQESRALAEELVQAVAARVRAGKVPPTDEEKARILLAQQAAAQESVRRELLVARVRLCAMWGERTPAFAQAGGDLRALPPIPDEATLHARLDANPDVARWDAEVALRRAALAQEEAARLPDVTVSAGVRRFGEGDAQAFVAGISVPLPIFDRNQGRVEEAARLLDKAAQERRAVALESATGLTAAHQSYAAAQGRLLALQDEILPRAKTVLESVQVGYAQGKFACLDLLDARRTYFDARAEQVEALVAAQLAWIDLARAAGGAVVAAESR